MANKSAVVKTSIDYVSPSGVASKWPTTTPHSVTCAYQASVYGSLDVPDSEAADTRHDVPFGDISAATGFVVVNRTGQELKMIINGEEATDEETPELTALQTAITNEDSAVTALDGAVTTLHTAVSNIDSTLTTQLGILNAFDNMDNIDDIIAAIATASTAIGTVQTALTTDDTAVDTEGLLTATTALDDAEAALQAPLFGLESPSTHMIPIGGSMSFSAPDVASTKKISKLWFRTTAEQSGEGLIEFILFGDPV